jgi:hypothetical protein
LLLPTFARVLNPDNSDCRILIAETADLKLTYVINKSQLKVVAADHSGGGGGGEGKRPPVDRKTNIQGAVPKAAVERHHMGLYKFWESIEAGSPVVVHAPDGDDEPFWLAEVVKPPNDVEGPDLTWKLGTDGFLAGVAMPKGYLVVNLVWYSYVESDGAGNRWYRKWVSEKSCCQKANSVSPEAQKYISAHGAFTHYAASDRFKLTSDASSKIQRFGNLV